MSFKNQFKEMQISIFTFLLLAQTYSQVCDFDWRKSNNQLLSSTVHIIEKDKKDISHFFHGSDLIKKTLHFYYYNVYHMHVQYASQQTHTKN